MKRQTGVPDVLSTSAGGPITSIDLFAGAGGLTAGLHAGSKDIRTVRAVEYDLAAAATFEANHGSGLVYAGPIEQWLAEEEVPEVDLVVGGPPCQGFSQLNRGKVGVERNALWEGYAETIAKSTPKWFVMENVATFLKSPEYEEFVSLTRPGGLLADWRLDARVLLAADYGAPQKRRRAVLIGHRRDVPAPGFPLPTHARDSHRTVAEAFYGIRRGVTAIELPSRTTTYCGRDFPGVFRSDELHVTRDYEVRSRERFRCIPAGGNRFDLPEELKTRGWRAHTSGSGDVMGRMVWEKPSVTIRTEFFKPEKGRYLHPTEHRAITHFEAARLQGFPDDYLWVGSKVDIARQIGNAVPLALGRALGEAIAFAAMH
ncbi:MAG: DNA cytosine methyltransferase [Dermatophilaceae bacterium]